MANFQSITRVTWLSGSV